MTTTPVMSITDEQIAEIEALAEFSTGGEWTYAEHDDCDYVEGPCSEFIGTADNIHDGYWIAAANPAKILALISRLRTAESDSERIEWLASQCEMRYGHRENAQYSADFGIFFQSDRDQCRPCDFRAAIDTAMKGDQQ